MSDYGSVEEVQAYIKHMTLDNDNNPTTTDIETWLDRRSAQITVWLSQAGYVTPVTALQAKSALDYYAVMGAAGSAELSLKSSGYDDNDLNARENKFLAEFNRVKDFIAGGGLTGLGVPLLPATSTASNSSLTFVPATWGTCINRGEW